MAMQFRIPEVSQRFKSVIIVGGAIGAITMAYRFTPPDMLFFSKGLQYLYFLPIVVSAFWWGTRGALIAAAITGIGYLAAIYRPPWPPSYTADAYSEALDLVLVGSILGVLADRERRRSKQLEQVNSQLAATYRELQENFEHLRRAEKFSAVGQLAASLAHEIRNPLASIEGAADLLRPGSVDDRAREELVLIIQKESKRLSRLLTELLDYSRPRRPEYQRVSMDVLLSSVTRLASAASATCRIRIVPSETNLPPVECDPEQIRQVVLNLTMNAIQAMPQGGLIQYRAGESGGNFSLEIRDEGPGIPASEFDKLFSPFYTTKTNGTGLGLAIAQRIMAAHNGLIAVDNAEPHGAVFTLVLPLQQKRKVTNA